MENHQTAIIPIAAIMYPHRANHDSNARTRPLAYSEYCKDQPGRQQRALTTQQPRPATGTVLCGVPSLRQGDRPYREERLVIAREYVGDFSQQDRSLRHRHGGRARSVRVGSSRTLGNQSQGIHNPDYDPGMP